MKMGFKKRVRAAMKALGGDVPVIVKFKSEGKGRERGARSFDAAATNKNNQNYYQWADGKDADSQIMPDLGTLRDRAHYEAWNNSLCRGMINTLANDVVGSGPTLQYTTEVEEKFGQWTQQCDRAGKLSFGEMLWLDIVALCESGDALTAMVTAPMEDMVGTGGPFDWWNKSEVSLRLLSMDANRLVTPMSKVGDQNVRMGIEVDEAGKPIRYYVMKKNPGSTFNLSGIDDFIQVAAESMIHQFRTDRPEQSRGFPWITPALPLYAQLRRYIGAVLDAADWAASISGVIESTIPTIDPVDGEAFDCFDVERNMLMTMPKGWGTKQLKPEQPATRFVEFYREIAGMAARCLQQPMAIAIGNSQGLNYASGRQDHQGYFKAITVVRSWTERIKCNRVLGAWLEEARRIPGYLRDEIPANLRPQWNWPAREHVDPVKNAKAEDIKLENDSITYATVYGSQGKDWEKELEQRGREKKKRIKEGLIDEDVRPNGGKNNKPAKGRSQACMV